MCKEKLPAYKMFAIIMSGLVVAGCFMPWVKILGESYTVFELLVESVGRGDMLSFISHTVGVSAADLKSSGAGAAVVFVNAAVYLFLAVALLYLIYIVMLIRRKHHIIPEVCGGSIVIIAVHLYAFSVNMNYIEGVSGTAFPYITMFFAAVEFIGSRFLREYKEAEIQAEKSRRLEKLAKAERKQRLAFPGKYSRLFYEMVWNNFKAGFRHYVMFAVSALIAVAFLFSTVTIMNMMSGLHSEEFALFGDGVSRIMTTFVKIVVFFSVFLEAFVLNYYVRSRIESYGMYSVMGMRKKTLFFYVFLEFVFSLTPSFLLGLAAGAGIVRGFKLIVRVLAGFDIAGTVAVGQVLGLTILLYLLTFAIAVFINYIQIADFGLSKTAANASAGERMPSRHVTVMLFLGAAVMCIALNVYRMRQWAESKMLIAVFLIGLFFVLRYGMCIILRRRKKKSSYYRRLLADNNLYHWFKNSTNYIYVLTVIHFLILSVFSIQLISCFIAEPVKKLYPYDYVCHASDDDVPYLEQAGNEYGASVKKYPMVRVTAVDGSEKMDNFLEIMLPQSQNVGISETTYRQLKEAVQEEPGKELEINDGEVYIVYQQDKSVRAHPVDWFMDRSKPYLHIGLPVYSYNTRNKERDRIFPQRVVAGEAFGSVTGVFGRGMQENLIVLSDAYFEQVKQEADGPSWLVTMNVPEENKEDVEASLEKFRENHAEEEAYDYTVQSWYLADDKAEDLLTERLMNESVTIFILLILLVAGLCIYYIKIMSEKEIMKHKYEFLECLGMRSRERRRTLTREMGTFVLIPLTIAAACAVVFTGVTFYLRMYTSGDIIRYVYTGFGIWSGYVLIQAGMYLALRRNVLRYIEGDRNGKDN